MSGEYEVGCEGCGERHTTSADEARKRRVLRCACGQFVRLDRGLVDRRSEPVLAAPTQGVEASGEEEEATHLLSSLAAVAALGSSSARLPGAASRARASHASFHESEHGSRPPPRGTLHSLSGAPSKYPSSPPPAVDKPLWYVDLGGRETVEMTIEQLIIARRSGKLGEGALVWREGMPRWRPVGELIPATSIAAAGSTPIPPPPSPPPLPPLAPLPSRPASRPAPPAPSRARTASAPAPAPRAASAPAPAPSALGSYERPVATLEFALEKPAQVEPGVAVGPPLPSVARAPSRPPQRSFASVQRSASGHSPAPASPPALTTGRGSVPPPPPPPPALSTLPPRSPLPPRSRLSGPPVTPIPTPLPSFTSDRPVELPAGSSTWGLLGDRPRWVSACIALAVCVAASSSGALLVRALKIHRQPLALATSPVSGAGQASPGTAAPNGVAPLAPAAAASAPLVVDLQSLSVEHSPPRRPARPIAAPIPKPTASAEANEPSVENTDPIDDEPSTASPKQQKPADLPSAARSNPYTPSSSDSDQ